MTNYLCSHFTLSKRFHSSGLPLSLTSINSLDNYIRMFFPLWDLLMVFLDKYKGFNVFMLFFLHSSRIYVVTLTISH
jgi:hypothetical protein